MKLRSGRLSRVAAVTLGLCAVVGLSGCGGNTSVSGKITHAGKPVVWGSVTLVDQAGEFHQGNIQPDGTYTIDSVPVGAVKIGVTSPKPAGESGGKGGKTAPEGGGGKTGPARGGVGGGGLEDPRSKHQQEPGGTPNHAPPGPPAGAWFTIPDKVRDPMTSGLTGTVTPGKPLDIDIPK